MCIRDRYYDENGEIVFKSGDDLPDEYVRGQQQLPFAPAILNDTVGEFLGDPFKNEVTASMKEYAGKFTDGTWERWPNAYMTLDEKDDISTTETDLQDYSKNQLAKWIYGAVSYTHLDAYNRQGEGLMKW